MRTAVKRLLERAAHRRVKTIEPGAVAFIDSRTRHADWFSHDLVLERLFVSNHVNLVIDVGANEGQFARRLRRTYAGDIMSFEPIETAFDRLRRAASGDAHWRVFRMALGNAETTATMHVASDTVFSSLLPSNDFSRQRFRQSVVETEQIVPVKRLDDVLGPVMSARPRSRVFLKLDTQGYDLEVFRGLGTYVDKVVMMQSEVSVIPIYDGMPHWLESIAAYERAGFAVAAMFPVSHDTAGRVIEYDCVLVRKG